MICPNCKSTVEDGNAFCSKCGYNFKTKEIYTTAFTRKKYYIIGAILFVMYVLWLYSPSSTPKNDTYKPSAASSQTQNYDAKPENAKSEPVQLNTAFSSQGIAELTIKNVEFVEKVLPKDRSGYYTYYTADEGKIYYVANAVLKNLKKDKEDMDKLVSADVYYDDGYKYHCVLMIEHRGRLENLYETVDPLQDENVKFAVQLPKEAQTDSKPIKMVFEIGKHKFEYTCR